MPNFLPILGKFSKKNEEFLLALEISEEKKIKVALWQSFGENKYKILEKAIKKYEGDWEKVILNISQLVLKLIKEKGFSQKVKKVIFAVPKSFIEGEKIAEPYFSYLKKLCHELSLIPLGFVETSQAIAFLLKEKKGYPQTMILLRVTPSYFSFNIFELGKELGGKTVFYKENLARELSQVLKKFSNLPSKIILYDDEENLEEIKQELLSFPWQKESDFLHFPKIEILDKDFSLLALVSAGASKFFKESQRIDKEKEVLPEELGFLKEKDVIKGKKIPLPVVEKEEEKKEKEVEEIKKEAYPLRISFPRILPKVNLKLFFLILFLAGLFLVATLYYLYWLLPQAKVILFIEPYSLEKDTKITLDLEAETLNENLSQLPAKEVRVEKGGSEKIATSTKKEVGQPARGEITIYNKTTSAKLFPKGTVVIGPKDLKFTLDSEVLVASLSDVVAGIPGKEKVKVTAVKIGPEGNLGAGSDFTFKDYPITLYAARNERAFSEGVSREVSVVGKKDQDDLFSLLKEKLAKEAKEELETNLDPKEKLLAKMIEGEVLEKKFSHEVGDETGELTLDLKMRFKGVSFKKDDLTRVFKKIIEETTPKGYKFGKEEVVMEVLSAKREKEKILVNTHFKVKLLPEIKEEELKEKLVRKELREIEDYLKKIPNISGFKIKLGFCPPLMGKTFPFNPKRIFIETSPL